MKKYLIALMLVVVAFDSQATTVRKIPFNNQAVEADLIVLAKVTGVEDAVVGDFPFKKAVVSIEETIAGVAPSSTINVIQPGGKSRRTGREVRVMGVRYLAVGDEVVLFLRKLPSGDYEILGISQGQYRVVREVGSGRKLISLPDEGRGPRATTLDGAKRRIHAARENAASHNGKEAGK